MLASKALPVAVLTIFWTLLTALPTFSSRGNVPFRIGEAMLVSLWAGGPLLLTGLWIEIRTRRKKCRRSVVSGAGAYVLQPAFVAQALLLAGVNVIATQAAFSSGGLREAGMLWAFAPFGMIKFGVLAGSAGFVVWRIRRVLWRS